MKSIKTGVDRLVEMISQKKRIELEEAAKVLGVGTNVVQEWAEFLEQEGLITIDYTLSKIYLQEKKITKDDVVSNVKELSSQRDAFARKIDVAIKSLDTETVGFEEIKKKFAEIQSHIKTEIDTVKSELAELQKFESLKLNLDKDIAQQKKDYQSYINGYISQVKGQEDKYNSLLSEIDKEKKVIDSYKEHLGEMRKLKEESERIISVAKDSLKTVEKALSEGADKVNLSEKKLNSFRSQAEKIYEETAALRVDGISAALKTLKSKAGSTNKEIDTLLENASEKTAKLGGYVTSGKKIFEGFEGFFLKNIETEKFISQIETDKNELQKQLEAMKAKAQALTLMSKNKDIKTQLKNLDLDMVAYEKQKAALGTKIEKMVDNIKGSKT